MNVKFYDHLGI